MSRSQDQHHYFRSRPSFAPFSAPPYFNPYVNPSSSYHSSLRHGGQGAIDPRLRFAFNMPGFSSLTNSALVDALLTPSGNEPQQQEQQQEQERNDLPVLARSSDVPDTNKTRALPADATLEESLQASECDAPAACVQPTQDGIGKRSRKQQKRKHGSSGEVDGDYVNTGHLDDPETPPRVKKPRRSARPKKSPACVRPSLADEDQSLQSTQKAARKARPGRLIRKKPVGISVPKTLNEAGPADRMMWEWKNAGKNWEEIRTEWKRITGVEPGGSSLSVRYIKLVENLARNGAASDLDLLRFKKEAENELMDQLWPKVAEKMLAFSPGSEHNPKDLQKRYTMIVRSGYDVEKLLAEDKMSRGAEQKAHEVGIDSVKITGSLHESGPAHVGAYDSAVANSASVSLNNPRRQSSPQQHNHGSSEMQNDISADAANIFENIGLLHEVDGLNEPDDFTDIKYQIPVHHDIGSFMSDDTLLSHSPLGSREGMLKQFLSGRAPLAGSLVGYNSDSE